MIKVLEVCTVSSSTYALVFPRAHALNQRFQGQMQVDILCTEGAEVALMRQQGMKVITTPLHRSLNPLNLAKSLFNLRKVLSRHRYDVIHLHFGIPGLVGRVLAPFYQGSLWLYQSHGYSFTENTHPLATWTYLGIERILKNTVHYSLFQLKEDIVLAKHYKLLNESQILYLGNGININNFQPKIGKNVITTFGMVARFESIKNHALLIQATEIATRYTRNFKIKLIGQGPLKDEIQQTIKQKRLNDIIEITPYSNDMPNFYQSIDVGILTSHAEGIPRALIEPMACGKPVICTNVKGSREAIINEVTGFTTPLNSPEILAKILVWFIQNPEKRIKMGQAARQHVVKHFSEERILEILANLYLQGVPNPELQPPLEQGI